MGEASRSAHLYDGGLADVLRHGGAIEDAVAVGGPLDVAQPARPVRVAHQVGVERDGVVAGVTYEQKRLMRLRLTTSSLKLNLMRLSASFPQRRTNCSLGLNDGALQHHHHRQREASVFT